jgi:hypothetical protein
MKNLLLSLIIITGFAACKSDPKIESGQREIQLLTDSTAFINNNIYSDTLVATSQETIPAKMNKPNVTVNKRRPVNVQATASKPAPVIIPTTPAPQNKAPEVTPPLATPPVVANTGGTGEKSGTIGSGNNSSTGSTATIPQPAKKKGWNKATQGAVIGGATGAVGGAILSKKKGVGAVVGAVVGAAGGYIIGKNMDKKDNKFLIE